MTATARSARPSSQRRCYAPGLADENIDNCRIFVEALIVKDLVPKFLGILMHNLRITMLLNTDLEAVKGLFNDWRFEWACVISLGEVFNLCVGKSKRSACRVCKEDEEGSCLC